MGVSTGVGHLVVTYSLYFDHFCVSVIADASSNKSIFDDRLELHLSGKGDG